MESGVWTPTATRAYVFLTHSVKSEERGAGARSCSLASWLLAITRLVILRAEGRVARGAPLLHVGKARFLDREGSRREEDTRRGRKKGKRE